jgi:hypothetical protein
MVISMIPMRQRLLPAAHLLSSTELPSGELGDVPMTEEDPPLPEFLSTPSLEARQAQETTASKNDWAKIAQQQGLDFFMKTWRTQVSELAQAVMGIDMARQPRLCPAITSSIIDSCKKGMRTQVAYCKKSLRDIIANCKGDVGRSVDRCKKTAKWPWQKPECEARRAPGMLRCETRRLDVPFCELDRLTASRCEGLREYASAMCRTEFSIAEIQKQIQSAQAMCPVATGLAKVAMKTYLSGQALGLITQLESVKTIGDTIQVIRKAEQTRSQFDKWTLGLKQRQHKAGCKTHRTLWAR